MGTTTSGTAIAQGEPMTGKLLQILGVLFVLGLVGGAVAGFGILKDRVKVVIAADEAASGPEPVALLRDDVKVLAEDLGNLQQALGPNFEQLANGIEERAAARHGEMTALRREVALLQQQLAELARAQATARAEMGQLVARLEAQPAARLAASGVPGAIPVEPAPRPAETGGAEPAPVANEPPVAVAPPVAVPTTADAAPAPSKPKGAFLFGGSKFRCDEPNDYEVVPELSRVGFDAKSTLHDFTGVTQDVSGRMTIDFDDPAGAWTGTVRCMAASLKTGVDGRDSNMWEYLDSKNHPAIEFTLGTFVPAAGGVDVAKQTARGEVTGTMTIRGKARAVRMPVELSIDPQRRLVLNGEMPLRLPDYEVPVPSQLGVINMQEEVRVWIALRARVKAAGKADPKAGAPGAGTDGGRK